jgi:hypothetical protein
MSSDMGFMSSPKDNVSGKSEAGVYLKSGEDLDEVGSTSQGPKSISRDVLYSSRELWVNHQRVPIRMYLWLITELFWARHRGWTWVIA